MPPLILHNVPDDELYVGEDGIQRPYAMVFPGSETQHSTRSRKPIAESGSFGRSVRRSRSKTGTPARKEDPNILVADAIFSSYVAELNKKPSSSSNSTSDKPRRPSASSSQQNLPSYTQVVSQHDRSNDVDHEPNFIHHPVHRVPTEVILRGYRSTQQYAAISHYETLAGPILEDYPRDPPLSQRKFKADLRDSTALRPRALTPEEKAKALSFSGGDNWIKITFESEEAAEVAIEESPQTVMGFSVYAELWRGVPPTEVGPVPAPGYGGKERHTVGAAAGRKDWSVTAGRDRPFASMSRNSTLPSSESRWAQNFSPSPDTSEVTLDTATISETQSTSTLAGGPQHHVKGKDEAYCRRIPTAKKMQLLPASDALLPQQSYSQKLLASIPIISWITGDIIGSEVPRKDDGEFDWALASFYWRLMWWLDFWLGFFGGDISGSNKDD